MSPPEPDRRPDPLPPERLALRGRLPVKPDPCRLSGRLVRLEPLVPGDVAERLHRLSCGLPAEADGRRIDAYDADSLVWRYMPYGPFETAAALCECLERLCALPDLRALCVRSAASGTPVGVACLMSNQPDHLRIELGHIWYAPVAQGGGFNREACFLLLEQCFGLGYRRVEWKCDALNERSRRAALGLGFRFEGIQEAHMIVKGRSRDTAWFRLLDCEWPEVRRRRSPPL